LLVKSTRSTITAAEFHQRLQGAPDAVVGFFETVKSHFNRRNDCTVDHTKDEGGDLRISGIWGETKSGKPRGNRFASMSWKPQLLQVKGLCKLIPDELDALGFNGKRELAIHDPSQGSEFWIDETYWRYRVGEFITILEAARIKLVAMKTGEL
jgi:hypothetical protein